MPWFAGALPLWSVLPMAGAVGVAWLICARWDCGPLRSTLIVTGINALGFALTLLTHFWAVLGAARDASVRMGGLGAVGPALVMISIALAWTVVGGLVGVCNAAWERNQQEI